MTFHGFFHFFFRGTFGNIEQCIERIELKEVSMFSIRRTRSSIAQVASCAFQECLGEQSPQI